MLDSTDVRCIQHISEDLFLVGTVRALYSIDMRNQNAQNKITTGCFISLKKLKENTFLARSVDHLIIVHNLQPLVILDSACGFASPDNLQVYHDQNKVSIVAIENIGRKTKAVVLEMSK